MNRDYLAGAEEIASLAETFGSSDHAAAKAAGDELMHTVHHTARPGAAPEARAAASDLLKLIHKDKPRKVRAEALRYLGFVGGKDQVTAMSELLHEPGIREDARLALERIPDHSAGDALRKAARTVPPDYKPAIEQSLTHRGKKLKDAGLKV